MMKEKKKKGAVVPEMRERLMVNRTGKLTTSQWLDIVMQPMVTILVLMIPFGVFVIPRFLFLMVRGGWAVVLVLTLLMLVSFIFRAAHFAREPIRLMNAYARVDSPPFWMFWKPLLLIDENGAMVKFSKRLAPRPFVQRGEQYLVYYLKEGNDYVLLSIAPEDHEDAQEWQPTTMFEARLKRRSKA